MDGPREEPTVRLSLAEELLGGYDEPVDRPAVPEREAAPAAPDPAPAAPDRTPGVRPPIPGRTPLLVAGAAAGVLVLLGAAFGVGRLVAANGPDAGGTAASSATTGATQGTTGDQPPPYDGPVRAVGITGSTASCQSGAGVDAAGNQVTYESAQAHDADLSTAWRCPGSGKGERLVLSLPEGTVVAQLGLVPGYAKTDPASGENRYAQNNRITRVRWHLDDGTSYVQRMRGNPADRSMRTLRVPATESDRVELEILSSVQGPRNTVAISELAVASPADD